LTNQDKNLAGENTPWFSRLETKEVSSMNTTTKKISQDIDSWIDEEEFPVRPFLKPIKKFDGLYPENEDEREAYREHLRWFLTKDLHLIMSIPKPEDESDCWTVELDEEGNDTSAFNTIDFQELQQPFNKYHYRLKKVYERVKDLAETHASISDSKGKENIFQRYKVLVENEFRDRAIELKETYKKYKVWCYKQRLMSDIKQLNRQIRLCKKIWRNHAYLP